MRIKKNGFTKFVGAASVAVVLFAGSAFAQEGTATVTVNQPRTISVRCSRGTCTDVKVVVRATLANGDRVTDTIPVGNVRASAPARQQLYTNGATVLSATVMSK